jgi:hypothetical protein
VRQLRAKHNRACGEVQSLPDDIKEKVFYFIDVSIKDFKTRQAYSS